MSGSQTQSTPKWPTFAKERMRDIAHQAEGLYNNPSTAFLPQLNQWTTQGIGQRAAIAGGGNTIAGPALDEARKILSGGYLDATQNPAFQRNMQEAMRAASQRFAGSGRVGSGAYAGALGDAATGVAANMYNVERERQMDALSMTPQMIASQYADASALEDAGRAMDEDTMARFDWPYARLDRYASSIYGSPASQIPGTKSATPFNWMAALGGLTPKINLPGMGGGS